MTETGYDNRIGSKLTEQQKQQPVDTSQHTSVETKKQHYRGKVYVENHFCHNTTVQMTARSADTAVMKVSRITTINSTSGAPEREELKTKTEPQSD